jgi:hypothetical protein
METSLKQFYQNKIVYLQFRTGKTAQDAASAYLNEVQSEHEQLKDGKHS